MGEMARIGVQDNEKQNQEQEGGKKRSELKKKQFHVIRFRLGEKRGC
jgi:hypothetical protein